MNKSNSALLLFFVEWLVAKRYARTGPLLPYFRLLKMRYYLDLYGRLKRGVKNALYKSNSFCETCGATSRQRMKQSVIRGSKKWEYRHVPTNCLLIPPTAW